MRREQIAAELARIEATILAVESGTHASRIRMGDREIERSKVDMAALRLRRAELQSWMNGTPRRTPARRVLF